MEEINCLDFGSPEVHNGELVVPIVLTEQTVYGPDKTTIYLPREKLETLSQRAQSGIEAIDSL